MSCRSACRLETLGCSAVYGDTAGKSDWLAAGLSAEGPAAATPRPGDLARSPVPACGVDDTIATARGRATAAGEDRCVVVAEHGVVLGVVMHSTFAGDEDELAGDAMREGPNTIRAHEQRSD